MEELKVKYALLNGKLVEGVRTFKFKEFPGNYNILDFISQIDEEPNGMFFISALNLLKKQFTLTQLDCDEIHWKGDENSKGYGPNEDCERKKCPFRKKCPISTHLMTIADIY